MGGPVRPRARRLEEPRRKRLPSMVWIGALALSGFGALGPGASVRAAPPADDPDTRGDESMSRRLHTYSIVARDPKTGRLGVAVHSHWFNVGRMVPWAKAGVGVVATQALTNASFGPRALQLLERGASPKRALEQLLASDAGRDQRQLAILDAAGRVAVWTGKRCIHEAGHRRGKGFAVQANMMGSAAVWPAMARAFSHAGGQLAERMITALRAAERAGGDVRGRQSAALIVVQGKSTGQPWVDRLIDLRVADHPRPIDELDRLLSIRRAYDSYSAGDEALRKGHRRSAERRFREARRRLPDNTELPFWQAVALYNVGDRRSGLKLLLEVVKRDWRWAAVLERLPASGILVRAAVTKVLERAAKAGAARREGGGRGKKK